MPCMEWQTESNPITEKRIVKIYPKIDLILVFPLTPI
jgi:hypothetical protein